MIHHHTENTGIFGAIWAVMGYFIGMASDIIPEPEHWYSSLLPAALAALVGWIVTKLCNWLWPIFRAWFLRTKWKLTIRK